jgi:hypothetical protein
MLKQEENARYGIRAVRRNKTFPQGAQQDCDVTPNIRWNFRYPPVTVFGVRRPTFHDTTLQISERLFVDPNGIGSC